MFFPVVHRLNERSFPAGTAFFPGGSVAVLLCQIVPELLVEEMVAAAHPLEVVHSVEPWDEAQGELLFCAEAEAEEVMLKYRIGAEEPAAKDCHYG
ncbi:MAG: hypothetical protein D3904_10925 [Candidatus Electrothrix sp. EH2]|nr:hypothetical protein [Candidatus Electrothrix sp. EH2]